VLFFIIGLLINRFKRDSKSVNNSNKLNHLSKYLDPSVITRSKALKESKNELGFRESS
jgi:hypothetical protein